jgi:hypothetical protein
VPVLGVDEDAVGAVRVRDEVQVVSEPGCCIVQALQAHSGRRRVRHKRWQLQRRAVEAETVAVCRFARAEVRAAVVEAAQWRCRLG